MAGDSTEHIPDAPPLRAFSSLRLGAIFGSAVVVAQLGQLLWLVLGSRAMSAHAFGTVLAAQALYGVLQFVVDAGPTYYGARLVAASHLDAPARDSLVRVRLQLAVLASVLTLAVGAAGGLTFFVANALYAAALVLWALFNYWEAYGRGDGRPFSVYLVLRATGPPVCVVPFLLFGSTLPVYAVGFVECAALIAVISMFGQRPFESLVAALHADRGPWRKVLTIGLPNIAWQVALSAGVVLLGLARVPTAAAVVGVGVRLMTGVNQLAAVVATAIFPALARTGAPTQPRTSWGQESRMIDLAARIVIFVSSMAVAVYLVGESFFIDLFLKNGGVEAERTAAITLGASGLAGLSLVVAFVLIARHREGVSALAFCVGAALSVALSAGVILLDPAQEAIWVAAALATAQMASMILSVGGTARIVPNLRRPLAMAAVAATAVLAGALVATFAAESRPLVVALLLALGSVPLLLRVRNWSNWPMTGPDAVGDTQDS